jgi:hypothetical protein
MAGQSLHLSRTDVLGALEPPTSTFPLSCSINLRTQVSVASTEFSGTTFKYCVAGLPSISLTISALAAIWF